MGRVAPSFSKCVSRALGNSNKADKQMNIVITRIAIIVPPKKNQILRCGFKIYCDTDSNSIFRIYSRPYPNLMIDLQMYTIPLFHREVTPREMSVVAI